MTTGKDVKSAYETLRLHYNRQGSAAVRKIVLQILELRFTPEEADAHAEAKEVLRINPKFSAESYAKHNPLKDEASKKLFIDGMRKAGLPE